MIAFASRTGNVSFIVSRLDLPAIEIDESTTLEEPFLLLTYTDGMGEVPLVVSQFMQKNGVNCYGVVVSGNRNFGHQYFGKAGDTIAERWQIPLVRKIEMRGFSQDYEAIRSYYKQHFAKESRNEIVLATQ